LKDTSFIGEAFCDLVDILSATTASPTQNRIALSTGSQISKSRSV